uniref:HP domain-containing protein n=1 Tax=Macrostomum lignano TaxID=282301 RepID=A0A1I8FMB6_9PLAT
DLVQLRRRPDAARTVDAPRRIRVRAEPSWSNRSASPSRALPSSSVAQWDSSGNLAACGIGAQGTEDKARPSLEAPPTPQGLAKEAIRACRPSLQRADPAAPVGPFGAISQAHKSLMLVQIKGRRQAQARLSQAAPSVPVQRRLLPAGFSRDAVYLWQGELSNVLEASKASELAKWVAASRALGLRRAPLASRCSCPAPMSARPKSARFWRLLGYESPQESGLRLQDEEDSVYEQLLADTNAYYRVDTARCGVGGRCLVLVPGEAAVTREGHGGSPDVSAARGARGASGAGPSANASKDNAVEGANNVKKESQGVTVTQYRPFNLFDNRMQGAGSLVPNRKSFSGPASHSPTARVARHGRSVRVRLRLRGATCGCSRRCGSPYTRRLGVKFAELLFNSPYDYSSCLVVAAGALALALTAAGDHQMGTRRHPCEASGGPTARRHAGQLGGSADRLPAWNSKAPGWAAAAPGRQVTDGLKRSFQLETLSVCAPGFVTPELERRELPAESAGAAAEHLRHPPAAIGKYRLISLTGRLGGVGSGPGGRDTGRDREPAPAPERERRRGAGSRCKLDEERLPQVHVAEGSEPARLGPRRLFLVRGHRLEECLLVEVPRSPDSPAACCYLLLLPDGRGHLWLAARPPPPVCGFEGRPVPPDSCGYGAAWGRVRGVPGRSLGPGAQLDIQQDEDDEVKDKDDRRLFECISSRSSARSSGGRLAGGGGRPAGICSSAWCPIHGHEPIGPARSPASCLLCLRCPQPANAFVLFDAGSRLFLWQGWNPSEATAATAAASIGRRCRGPGCGSRHQQPACWYLPAPSARISAPVPQLEPDLGTGAPRHPAQELQLVHERLNNLSFTLERLQQRPLPEGVDPGRLEVYLDDAEFASAFSMTRHEFAGLNDWRRLEMKKALGLPTPTCITSNQLGEEADPLQSGHAPPDRMVMRARISPATGAGLFRRQSRRFV